MSEEIRQPVVVVLGHVDSGKTSLLDKIRGTAVQAHEAGGITQHIGASFFPPETLKDICGPLLKQLGGAISVPGLLVIDTPGHEVFTNLRSRGGSAADISIVVVDSSKGFEIQTNESIDILKSRKVPFVIALNKIDMITGWRKGPSMFLGESLKMQSKPVQDEVDNRVYSVMGSLSRLGFGSEVFYRVKDFTKEVAIVPVSARTGEGVPELIMVLVGLAQQYLRKRLVVTGDRPRGIVLEVKEEPGLGTTANVILLDGVLSTGERIVVGKRDEAIVTHVRAIFMPKPLDEIRDPRDRFTSVERVGASAGLKLITPDLEGTLAGSPLIGLLPTDNVDEIKKTVYEEVSRAFIRADQTGIVLKSDTLGSLEALVEMLRRRSVLIRTADIGPVTRRDVVEAEMVAEKDRYHGVILAFNVKVLPDAQEEIERRSIKVFANPVIYSLIGDYLQWVEDEREAIERREFSSLTPPCSFRIMKGYVFRRSDPAVVGVEILKGRLKQKSDVMDEEGKTVGTIRQIQEESKTIDEATIGAQVAVSIDGPMVGRQINEGDRLLTVPKTEEVKLLLEKFVSRLSPDEAEVLNEITDIRRRKNPLYGF
ncbi:MAG: translation initiation factor IF-2 [Thaumarchaeota archaeon]|nr:translation initiation factor IF-2 [Nitrososphaerota archaeon]MCL5318454.1 translation initiation factor IF-2 [Nitrososphaerota archaeon]